jgi:hypothetical protein
VRAQHDRKNEDLMRQDLTRRLLLGGGKERGRRTPATFFGFGLSVSSRKDDGLYFPHIVL